MSEPIIVAVIISVPPTVAAVAGLWKMHRIAQAIYSVHVELNGRLTQWIAATQAAAHAAGMKDQQEKDKHESDR